MGACNCFVGSSLRLDGEFGLTRSQCGRNFWTFGGRSPKHDFLLRFIKLTRISVRQLKDVIVNNAGVAAEFSDYMRAGTGASISQHPTTDWRRLCSINQDGVYFGIKYGAASMEKNPVVEGKSIVNISSGAGFIGGTGELLRGLIWHERSLTRCLAIKEWDILRPRFVNISSTHETKANDHRSLFSGQSAA